MSFRLSTSSSSITAGDRASKVRLAPRNLDVRSRWKLHREASASPSGRARNPHDPAKHDDAPYRSIGISVSEFSGSSGKWTIETPVDHPVGGAAKRALDIFIAGTALVFLGPLMISVAILLLLLQGRPVFFAHRRVGFAAREFHCFKFRTMAVDGEKLLAEHLRAKPSAAAEWKMTQKLKNDPRVSRLGLMLRKTSIDELPQLLNVVRGDMSCVGPRPITPDETVRYGSRIHLYFGTRPGITGAWQVTGRNETSYEQRVLLDSSYVRDWSIRKDVNILLRTLPVLFSCRGSY
jgi:exopolysaccharide production protein ExoY